MSHIEENGLQDQIEATSRENRVKMMKLKRLNRYNEKLREELQIDRIRASNSSLLIIDFNERTFDGLLEKTEEKNRYDDGIKNENNGCCTIV